MALRGLILTEQLAVRFFQVTKPLEVHAQLTMNNLKGRADDRNERAIIGFPTQVLALRSVHRPSDNPRQFVTAPFTGWRANPQQSTSRGGSGEGDHEETHHHHRRDSGSP